MKKILPFLILNVYLYLIFSFGYGTFNLINIDQDFRVGIAILISICNGVWLAIMSLKD